MRTWTAVFAIVVAVCVGGIAGVFADHVVTNTPIPDVWQDSQSFSGVPVKIYKSELEDCSLVIDKTIVDRPHDVSLVMTMICDDEDDRDYWTYNQDTDEVEQHDTEPGPFVYGVQEIEVCDFDIVYRAEQEYDFGNSTVDLDESFDLTIDCTVDD